MTVSSLASSVKREMQACQKLSEQLKTPQYKQWEKLVKSYDQRLIEALKLEKLVTPLISDLTDQSKFELHRLSWDYTALTTLQTKIGQQLISASGGKLPITLFPPKTLTNRVLKGLFNHSGKIAFVATGLLLAGQTEAGTQFLKESAKYLWSNSEPIRTWALGAVQEGLQFVGGRISEGLDKIAPMLIGGLTPIWMGRGLRLSSTTTGLLSAVGGVAMAALPYVMEPDFSLHETITKIQDTGREIQHMCRAVYDVGHLLFPKVFPMYHQEL